MTIELKPGAPRPSPSTDALHTGKVVRMDASPTISATLFGADRHATED